MSVPYLDVGASYRELAAEIDDAYTRVMSSGRYVLGEELEQFELEFASIAETTEVIGVGNGLDALAIALRSAGVKSGDEVIVPAFTFVATWLAVLMCGAQVVPVDVEPETLSIDPEAVSAACSSRTTAILPVHLYGRPANLERLEQLARKHGVALISDAAQAHGARVTGRPIGTFGDAAIFSFYPAKNLGAFGDGGAICTNSLELARNARRARNYGSESRYEFVEAGVNSRLDPLQAAFLRVKLRVLGEWNSRRARVAERYLDELSSVDELRLPARSVPGMVQVWHVFAVRLERRDELRAYLASRGIETLIHYPEPPHLTDAFANLQYVKGDFPVSEGAADTVLSLPIGPHMEAESVSLVIEGISEWCH